MTLLFFSILYLEFLLFSLGEDWVKKKQIFCLAILEQVAKKNPGKNLPAVLNFFKAQKGKMFLGGVVR